MKTRNTLIGIWAVLVAAGYSIAGHPARGWPGHAAGYAIFSAVAVTAGVIWIIIIKKT